MQQKVYVRSFEENEVQVKKYSTSQVTDLKDTEIAKNIAKVHFAYRINHLYCSIIDAKKVLSEYKSDLSNFVSQDGCLTPLCESNKLQSLFYKREDLTSIKAYKVRGALYQMQKILQNNPNLDVKFIAASTGNHALGVLKSAEILKVSTVVICISKSVTEFKREKLEKRILSLRLMGVNARLISHGKTFDETNDFAQKLAEADETSFYIDPYNNNNALAGQGTIGLELLTQLQNKFGSSQKGSRLKELTVIVPIGGGGLVSGVACALKSGLKNFPALKNLELKVVGVNLEDLNSKYGDAIKVTAVGSNNDEFLEYFLEKRVQIGDKDMKNGMDFVFGDIGACIEGASAGTLKPVLEGMITPSENHAVVCLLSGGNVLC